MNGIDESIRQLGRMAKALDQAISALRGAAGESRDGEKAEASSLRPPTKRHLSAAGRKRIAEAARKRWAALRAGQKTAMKPATKKATKRRLSAEGRQHIVEAAKQRWAAKRAADAAAEEKRGGKAARRA